MNRRGFLTACLAAATAPYVVTSSGVLMPVSNLVSDEYTKMSLEDALVEIMKLTDDRGLKIQLVPSTVFWTSGMTKVLNQSDYNLLKLQQWASDVLAKKRPALCGYGYTTDYPQENYAVAKRILRVIQ